VPSLRDKFGLRIKAIRLERKMSQERFAELLDISVDFLSLIERGVNLACRSRNCSHSTAKHPPRLNRSARFRLRVCSQLCSRNPIRWYTE
jgi:transcriptional regulator with XRE-family HTH domain